MLNRKSPAYRISVILVCAIILGAAIFGPLLGISKYESRWIVWIILGVYIAAVIGTIVINEILIRRKKKKQNEQ